MAKKPAKKRKPFVLLEDDSDEELSNPIPDEDGWIRLKRSKEKPPEKRPRQGGGSRPRKSS